MGVGLQGGRLEGMETKNTREIKFTPKVILFQETLEFSIIINLYYSRQTSKLQS